MAEMPPPSLEVSIHAPLRGATGWPRPACARQSSFNPRPSARGDPRNRRPLRCRRCFNPRPSARGDAGQRPCARPDRVSIHAPLRGATHVATHEPGQLAVSIHAPLRGATSGLGMGAGLTGGFNPRPSARGDRRSRSRISSITRFQSTPLCEGRPVPARPGRLRCAFQSTPLCEGRHGSGQTVGDGLQFQSTPLCEGRRDLVPARHPRGRVSIHAPLRGATSGMASCARTAKVSIHAPLRGATCF